MSDLHLIVGNKNYSSWSMRGWLVLRESGLPFRENVVWLSRPDSAERKRSHSRAGRVPVLKDGSVTIWDSLAIAEYVAERAPALWPEAADARAVARSACAEMHSGFFALREELPMNCRARGEPRERSPAVQKEVARIVELWEDARTRFGAGAAWLFGRFSIADAFFAPVASRFRTYGVALPETAQRYADLLLARPSVTEWMTAAAGEEASIEIYDRRL